MDRTVMKKFHRSYQELQDKVLLTGIDGVWEDKGNLKRYRAENGAVLNWWESKGTILIQGNHEGALELESALLRTAKTMKPKQSIKRYEDYEDMGEKIEATTKIDYPLTSKNLTIIN